MIFVRRPGYCAQAEGAAYVVCDGCLETLQRHLLAWTYCYLPRTVRS